MTSALFVFLIGVNIVFLQLNRLDTLRIPMQEPSPGNSFEETASRKDLHLDLALESQHRFIDGRFNYEPMLAAHPDKAETWAVDFGGKPMRFPIWVSSMTGGTSKTNEVNRRLAGMVKQFGFGMGVGSARIAVEDSSREADFHLRPLLGDSAPFYLNFGIAQIEKFLQSGEMYKLKAFAGRINADGFIIHVNPMQEWMQPEGDRITKPPLTTIKNFLNELPDASLIVKEVGQGFGPESMKALLTLPLTAVEFAAAGGTNFAKLELLRDKVKSEFLFPFVSVGHTATEMVDILNSAVVELGRQVRCGKVIISGGLQNFLDGYYLIKKSKIEAVYGMASAFLKQALVSQEALNEFAAYQTEGLLLARQYLKLK